MKKVMILQGKKIPASEDTGYVDLKTDEIMVERRGNMIILESTSPNNRQVLHMHIDEYAEMVNEIG